MVGQLLLIDYDDDNDNYDDIGSGKFFFLSIQLQQAEDREWGLHINQGWQINEQFSLCLINSKVVKMKDHNQNGGFSFYASIKK